MGGGKEELKDIPKRLIYLDLTSRRIQTLWEESQVTWSGQRILMSQTSIGSFSP